MQYGKDYYTLHYRTEWTDTDNVVISLYRKGDPIQIGIVEVTVFKTGERNGEAYIWNLHVTKDHRGHGYGRALLSDAYDVAMLAGCTRMTLEWDLRDSPKWIFDWYIREGFDEREFGRGCSFMEIVVNENVKTDQDEL